MNQESASLFLRSEPQDRRGWGPSPGALTMLTWGPQEIGPPAAVGIRNRRQKKLYSHPHALPPPPPRRCFAIATMAAILDIGTERFSNSEFPCHPDTSRQVSAQLDLLLGKRYGLASGPRVKLASCKSALTPHPPTSPLWFTLLTVLRRWSRC